MLCCVVPQVLGGTEALSVLGELSPGGALMSGTTLQQLHRMYIDHIDFGPPFGHS